MTMILFILLITATAFTSNNETDTLMAVLPPLINIIPKDTLHVITGNMLGDGSLRRQKSRNKEGIIKSNALFEMNKGPNAYNHAWQLFNDHYKQFSSVGFRENNTFSKSLGKPVTQYHIFTRSLPIFTALHSLWYLWDANLNKYIKVVPQDIDLMFSPLSLAHWIIDDGYFTDNTIILCTDNFTQLDCVRLQALLLE
jgi:LAGLIDADG DNA endonuclease family